MLAAGVKAAAPAAALPLDRVVATIRDAGGTYRYGAASLEAADCSGLVSVAQSLAMGQPLRRWGDTRSLLAGRWPHAIRGASPSDRFVIGADAGHMSAAIGGVAIEATCCGRPFLVGAQARSPFSFPYLFHVDEEVLL
jgi:hypothetical protein